MKKSRMLFFIIIVTSLMFSACTMKASTPPPVTPTTNLSEIARQATETALAKTPSAGETEVPEATQADGTETAPTVEGMETSTSTPEPTATPDPDEVKAIEYAVPDTYTLHQGEFVFCLGRRFNILPDDIEIYNNLKEGAILYPGDTISLPSDPRPFVGNRALQYHPVDYTVAYGDTLYSIACLFGDVDPRAIAAANDLDVDQALTAGTILQIP
jgi:LysM repeat protein